MGILTHKPARRNLNMPANMSKDLRLMADIHAQTLRRAGVDARVLHSLNRSADKIIGVVRVLEAGHERLDRQGLPDTAADKESRRLVESSLKDLEVLAKAESLDEPSKSLAAGKDEDLAHDALRFLVQEARKRLRPLTSR